jgi:hypothetical protein
MAGGAPALREHGTVLRVGARDFALRLLRQGGERQKKQRDCSGAESSQVSHSSSNRRQAKIGLSRERARHRVRLFFDDLEQNARAALGLASALLPIANGRDCKSVGRGKALLRETETLADFLDVNIRRDMLAIALRVGRSSKKRLRVIETSFDLVECAFDKVTSGKRTA